MGISFAACALPEDEPDYSETTSAISVGGAVTASCSTSTVRGLSIQIAQEVDCMSPNSLVKFSPSTRIKFSSNAVLPYLHQKAKTDLIKAGNQATLTINSGYRTVAQQYLLYRWDQLNRCGVAVAATPGRSNHESGRAIDLANWSSRVGVMANHHFSHSVPGDPVHFDHKLSPDNRGQDVRAFQRLWNRNHPGDKISVDGAYGPQTAARLKKSPAKGFAKGAQCKATERGAEILAIDGPDRIAPGEKASYLFTLANSHDVEWPATTRIVVAGGGASDLYDAASWVSAADVGTLGVAIPPGGDGDVMIEIVAPQVTEETAGFTTFALLDANNQQLGTFDLSVTITPNGDDGMSGDAGDGHDHEDGDEHADEDGVIDSGCSAGGSGGWGALLLAALALVSRRRRRS